MMNEMIRGFFRHGHGRHEGRWRGGWGGGFGGPWGPGWGGGRARRGDVKFLVLESLAQGPKHGYEIIRAIEESRGARPSAGSVYPTLQMLEDGGFVTSEQVDGKRIYTITDAGREMLANRNVDADDDDGEDMTPDARHRLRHSAMKLGAAVMGARGSDDATIDKIREILDRARKEVYGILASDET
jgi:DNA-binding PadR family transcriptional regulator